MNPRFLASARLATLRAHSDERLAELVRYGSEGAFEAIVARHRRALVRHCARILGEADAEEAVQEALLRAHSALLQGNEVRALGPWLHTIAHNIALNMLRAKAARPTAPESECECSFRAEDSLERRLELREMVDAVSSLPRRQREAIVMRELEGRSYEEIGRRLGASHGAVRQLLNRARSGIREKLGTVAGLAPLGRWLAAAGGGTVGRITALTGGCAATIKVCVALLPIATVGLIPGEHSATSRGSAQPASSRAGSGFATAGSGSGASADGAMTPLVKVALRAGNADGTSSGSADGPGGPSGGTGGSAGWFRPSGGPRSGGNGRGAPGSTQQPDSEFSQSWGSGAGGQAQVPWSGQSSGQPSGQNTGAQPSVGGAQVSGQGASDTQSPPGTRDSQRRPSGSAAGRP